MNTIKTLNDQVDALQRKLIDAKVDLNIKDERIRELEKRLREAHSALRELEIGTQTMRTLALEGDEEDFDPRQTGTFSKDAWSKVR
jgi:predicted RNase H-like nuclease (RuvC/YqgF family)